jgi:hypothetical protein
MTHRCVGVDGLAKIAGVERPEELEKVTGVSIICSWSFCKVVSMGA